MEITEVHGGSLEFCMSHKNLNALDTSIRGAYSGSMKDGAVARRHCVPLHGGLSMNKAFRLAVWLVSASIIGLSGPWAAAEQPLRIGSSLSITGKQYSAQGGYCREGYLLC